MKPIREVAKLPPRVMLYGVEGIGKTTFGASAPKPVFVLTEDGLGDLDVAHFPLAKSYDDVRRALCYVRDEAHDFETVVLDSLDWLERLIHDHVCMENSVSTIERVDGGYGRGYVAAIKFWRDVIAILDEIRDQRRMAIIGIAHAKVERFEDPESPAYDRYSPRLHKTSSALVTEWMDAVLFAHWRFAVRTETGNFGKTRGVAIASKTDCERVVRVSGGPTCVAKNRYGLTGELPLSWDAFAKAIGY